MGRRSVLASAVVTLLTAGCHTVHLQPVILTPAPSAVALDVAIEVKQVAFNPSACLGQLSACKRTHLAVGIELANQTALPVTVRVDDVRLVVQPDGADPRTARSVLTTAAGPGALPGQIDDRSEAGAVILAPGERRQVWVDFTDFFVGDADSGFRPRLSLYVPLEIAGQPQRAEVVLSDPLRAAPRWTAESRFASSSQFGAVWMNVPGRGLRENAVEKNRDVFGLRYTFGRTTGAWFSKSAVTLGWLTGVHARSDPGVALGTQFGRAFSHSNGSGVWCSWAPTFGLELAHFQDDAAAGTGERTSLIGFAGGLSLLFDRDQPSGGPLPFAPLKPRHGSIWGIQLLYVHWFGKVAEVPVGWTGAGYLATFWYGFYLL